MAASITAQTARGIVNGDIKVVPAKRTATYDVPLESDRERPRIALAKVQATDITLSTNYPGTGSRSDGLARIPKTLEAVRNLRALIDALEAELEQQGITA
jgi:hypothetical protein